MINGKIPSIRSSMPTYEEYINEIKPLWDSVWLTCNGEIYLELEKKLVKYLHVNNISLFSNGHLALEIILQSMQLKGEVITTPFTFASTTQAIVRNGLKPVFCDINPDDFTMDVTKIEALITKDTVAILPVHIYGNVCDVNEIDRIAKKYNLKVIYDAAHAFGVEVNGKGIGSFGDASMFSFHATKVFHTIEGGAIAYTDESIGKELSRLKDFGIDSKYNISSIGTNAKLSEFHAAMGICNLRHVAEEILKRKAIVQEYRSRLSNINGIKILHEVENVKQNYSYFPVIFDKNEFGFDRNEVFEMLSEKKIAARKYCYPITNSFSCFNGEYNVYETPVALKISESVLTLPLYAAMTSEDVHMVCDVILASK